MCAGAGRPRHRLVHSIPAVQEYQCCGGRVEAQPVPQVRQGRSPRVLRRQPQVSPRPWGCLRRNQYLFGRCATNNTRTLWCGCPCMLPVSTSCMPVASPPHSHPHEPILQRANPTASSLCPWSVGVRRVVSPWLRPPPQGGGLPILLACRQPPFHDTLTSFAVCPLVRRIPGITVHAMKVKFREL